MTSAEPDAEPPEQVAAVYGRTSTPKQASIPQQVDLCRRRCEQAGYRVGFVLREDGKSAVDERPKFEKLMQLVAERRITVIVVWKLDRLVRSLQDLLNVHKFLASNGVSLVSLTEQFDTTTAFGRFSFRNIASAAELEREIIAERSQLGRYSMALAGRYPANNPPYGYTLGEDRRLATDKKESVNVGLIFRWYDQGKPMTEISRLLAERNITTKAGKSLSQVVIGQILKNPVYAGKLVIMGVEHDRPDLRQVPQALWDRCQARRGKPNHDENGDLRRKAAIDAVFDDYLEQLRGQDDDQAGGQA